MARLLLFHHALGRTPGCVSFEQELVAHGHEVHAPDLYEGRTFEDLAAGVTHAQDIGFEVLLERARREADAQPLEIVYVGISLGVLPAQMLAQMRGGCRGAVLVSAAVPPAEFGGWPAGVPLQIHMMEGDPIVVTEGDLAAAGQLAAAGDGELVLHAGEGHLFLDASTEDHEPAAAGEAMRRMLQFLAQLD